MIRRGLTARAVDRAFPFHFAFDANRIIVQVGPSLHRVAPGARPGVRVEDVFSLTRASLSFSEQSLESAEGDLAVLALKSSRSLFRGQFERLDQAGSWIFLGTPWFNTAEAVEAAGLALSDFAPHDSISELLVVGQTQQIALKDLEKLAGRLAVQREQFRRTETLYRAAIAAANAVPYQEDFASDQFVYLNEGIEKLTGFKPAELRPSTLRALAQPDSKDVGDDTTLRGKTSLRNRRDFRIRTMNGDERWITDASAIVEDDRGNPIGAIGILEDITGRKRNEKRLRESEEEARRLALVVARTSNAVVLTDSRRRVEWVNEAFTRISGYELADVVGKSPGSLLQGPGTDHATVTRVRKALEAEEPVSFEILNYHRSGRAYWLEVEVQPMRDSAGELTGFMAVQADITARKRYEERLARLSSELDTILKLVPDGVVAFDASGSVSYCNAAFERLTGLTSAKVRGLRNQQLDDILAQLCAADQRPLATADLREGDADVIRLERPRRTIVARTVREVRGGYGNPDQRVIYLRDVTRETEIDRMKSEFLSLAAHELRTPMSSVLGFAELLISRDFDAATQRSIAQTIHRQSLLLVQMVNELLDLARIESGRVDDFNLQVQPVGPIITETLTALLIPGDDRKVDVSSIASTTPSVNVDAAKLRQAITNVVSNAYKYSRGKGAIRMSLPIETRNNRTMVGIRVQDEGAGMSEEQLSRIFERFYRADPSSGIPGTGLGMTLVREIIEIMGGSVDVASQPGQGTVVTLWLPTIEAD